MSKTPYRLGLPLAMGLGFAIRLYVIHSLNFDGLYGQDSFAYFYHGFALWHDHALAYHWPWLPAPTRLYWPMGYPALLAAAYSIAGAASANAAQITTLCCGLAVTALTYGLALRVSRTVLSPAPSHAAAFCAAALIACSGLQVQASVTIMSDAPALACALLTLWLWTGPPTGILHRRSTSLLAGASLAAAISTRYEYAPLIAAPFVYWWLTSHASQAGKIAPSLRFGLIGALGAGLPQLIYSTGYSAPVLNNEWLTGWSPRHLWQATFSTPDGVQHYAHSVGAFYLLRPLVAPESLPWILALFLPLGLFALAWNGGRRDMLPFASSIQDVATDARDHALSSRPTGEPELDSPSRQGIYHVIDLPIGGKSDRSPGRSYLALLLAWWLVPTFYLVGVPFQSARFALISQPALAIGEGIGLVWSASFLFSRRREYGPIITASAVVLAGCGLAVASANSKASVAVLAQGKRSDQAAITWIDAHAPSGSSIATFDLTLMLYHYGNLHAHHLKLYDLSAIDAADWVALAGAPHVLVVANVDNLTRQWEGLPPDESFRRLIEERPLKPIASAGAYTIYG